jgi:hypothetical protein
MTQLATALAKLRTDLDIAITLARQSGVPSRAIADILEQRTETCRQHQALMTPSSYV